MLVTPQIYAKDFFKNICADMTDFVQQTIALELVDVIFNQRERDSLRDAASHLNNEDPLGDLMKIAKRSSNPQYWVAKVEQLRVCLGPISVKLVDSPIPKDPPKKKDPDVMSSRHYDFRSKPRARL